MMKCENCGRVLKCTLTIDDMFENKITRRKYCYNCDMVYMTEEKVIKVKKVREYHGTKNEELQH